MNTKISDVAKFKKSVQDNGIPIRAVYGGKLTKKYIKLIKQTEGNVPMPKNIIYKPDSKNIVRASNVLTKNGKLRKKYRDLDWEKLPTETGFILSNEVRKVKKKLEDTDNAIWDTRKISFKKSLGLFGEGQHLIESGGTTFTMNEINRVKVLNRLENNQITMTDEADSIGEIISWMINYQIINIEKRKPSNNPNKAGFFRYYHKTNLDLSRYGIFNNSNIL